MRDGRWKLHYTPRKKKGLWELYDLEKDPEESRNLIKKGKADPEVLWPLLKFLVEHISETNELLRMPMVANSIDLDSSSGLAAISAEISRQASLIAYINIRSYMFPAS